MQPSSLHPLVNTRWLNDGQPTKASGAQNWVVVEVTVVTDVVVTVVFVVVVAVAVVVVTVVVVTVVDVRVTVVLVLVAVVVVVDDPVVVVGKGAGHLPSPIEYDKRRALRSFESCEHCDSPPAAA